MIRVALMSAAALLVAGCSTAPTVVDNPQQVSAPQGGMETIARFDYGDVDKFCDADRAVYIYHGFKSGGIAVVEGAPECGERVPA